MRDFLEEYLRGTADLAAFYSRPVHYAFDEQPTPGQWPPGLADAVNNYNRSLGKETSIRGDEAVVATGQQPVLFTGPLYTIAKAVTAISLAAKIEEKWRKPCIPIFWLGSDDHDFEEARAAHFLTKHGESLTVSYEPEAPPAGASLYRVPLDESINDFIDNIAHQTRGSDLCDDITRFLHESAAQAASLADWAARLLARLFRDTPLVVFAPHILEARRAAAPVIARELENPLISTHLLNEAGDRLEALGFAKQVTKSDDECGFFVEVGQRRCKVTYDGSSFYLPEKKERFSHEELRALLEKSPQRFTANVALRCIVQQSLFPVHAYVAGPGEVAYWGQFKSVFEHFGLPMPVVYPRARCVFTTLKLKSHMEKFGFSYKDLRNPTDTLVEQALRTVDAGKAAGFLETRRQHVEQELQELAKELDEQSPTGADMAKAMLLKSRKHFDRIHSAIIREDKARLETVQAQISRLCTALAPCRKPQERVYNIFSYLFEHGWGLAPRLVEELDIESFKLNEVIL